MIRRNRLTLYYRQEGRCLGCALILLLLLVISLLVLYIFRHEIEAWAYKKTIDYIEKQIEKKKLPPTPEAKELQKTFKDLRENLKRGRVERKKFWQAMRQLQKILVQESLSSEDLKKIQQILKEIPIRIQKELERT